MLRSMFTAISSLTLHQEFLDVISDNLANANTAGFKANRVQFQDQFAQLMNPGAGPTTEVGGINPTQIGLGLKLGYISPIFTQGMLQSTGRNLDLAIQGDGFFIYKDPTGTKYSREGSLSIDSNGNLVNAATGLRIQGWTLPAGNSGPIDTNTAIGDIDIPLNQTLARATSEANFGGNLNSDLANGSTYTVTFGVYDSLGAQSSVQIEFTRQNNTDWDWTVVNTPNATGSGTIKFNSDGQADPTSCVFTDALTILGTNGAASIVSDIDMSGVTMLSDANSISCTSQDGLAAGQVSDITVSSNTGEIYMLYSNGLKQLAGQIALAKFANPTGMVREGNNLYKQGLNSGEPAVGASNEGGRGALVAGYTEASNVDMAQEFTNMILAQRGFQASSRVITTSDEMILELVNLKR